MGILKLADFNARIEAAREIVKKNGLDAIMVFSTECEPAQVRYFSDYWPSFETAAVLVPAKGDAALLIGPESLTYASARTKIPNVIQLMDFRESSQPDYPGSRLPKWADVVKRYSLKKIGLSGYFLFPYAMMAPLAKAMGGMRNVVPADDMMRPLYMKKSPAEVKCLKAAAKASEAGFKAILEAIRPGMTEAELCGIATRAMTAAGAESTGYPIWCCSGPNSNQAISRPTMRKVRRGEIIHFSIGAKVEGYSASIGRPVVLGKCPKATLEFLQVGLDAANMTFDEMRAGREEDPPVRHRQGLRRRHPLRAMPRHGADGVRIPVPGDKLDLHARGRHDVHAGHVPASRQPGLPLGGWPARQGEWAGRDAVELRAQDQHS